MSRIGSTLLNPSNYNRYYGIELSKQIQRQAYSITSLQNNVSDSPPINVDASQPSSSSSSPPPPPPLKPSSNTNIDNKLTPVHLVEGLCAVRKPLEWTSQDAVGFVRGMLERDARERGATLAKRRGKGKNKVKVGHGGTLDPLAEGVLVLGVGKGTKMLQNYLSGSKTYRAGVKLGFETTTLDMAGNITNSDSDSNTYDHITLESIQTILPKFTGSILQTPPIYSAIRKNGKRMYEEARKGKTAEEIGIEPRRVEVHRMELLPVDENGDGLPCFGLEVECGGGTYIRSLVRDIGRELGTFATMTSLVRTQQGPFGLDMALGKEDWSVESINEALVRSNAMFDEGNVEGDEDDASHL